MKLLQDKTNVIAPDAAYEFGSIKDNPGDGTGTPANRDLFSDGMQFFEKLFDESGLTANGLPDNTTNGYQLYEAFRILARPYKVYSALVTQSGTSAPTSVLLENNTGIAAPTYSRTSTGTYRMTFASPILVSGKTATILGSPANGSRRVLSSISSTTEVLLSSLDTSATLFDGGFDSTIVEVRIYD